MSNSDLKDLILVTLAEVALANHIDLKSWRSVEAKAKDGEILISVKF